MKLINNKLNFILILCFICFTSSLVSQGSVTTTYTAGDIPTFSNGNTGNNVDDPSCNGNLSTIQISLPAGSAYEVTGIDIIYDIESLSNIWKSAQNSQIYCQNTSTAESTVYEGVGNEIGIQSYSRTNVNIANGVYPGGSILTFEMRASRDWPGSPSGCNSQIVRVNNSSWTITIHYGPEITPPRVGINNSNPKATLDVGGEIIIGDDGNLAEAGMIKWDAQNQDFMGYDGVQWKTLTVPENEVNQLVIPAFAFQPVDVDPSTSSVTHGGNYRSSNKNLVYPINLPSGTEIISISIAYIDTYTHQDGELTYALKSNNVLGDNVNVLQSFTTLNDSNIQSHIMNIDAVLDTGISYWIEQESNFGPFTTYGIKGAIINYILP